MVIGILMGYIGLTYMVTYMLSIDCLWDEQLHILLVT